MLSGRRSVVRLLFSIMPLTAAKPDKMDPVLRSLFAAWRRGGATRWKQEAGRLLFAVDHRNVPLRITLRSDDGLEAVRTAVTRSGGSHRSDFERFLYVSLPASGLATLSDNKWVAAMHLDTPEYRTQPGEAQK